MAKEVTTRNPVSKGIGFVNESYEELKKVHPPTRQETTQATIVVMVMTIMFAGFLGLSDFLVGKIMQSVLM